LGDGVRRFQFSYVSKDNKYNGRAVRLGAQMTSPTELTIRDVRRDKIVDTKQFSGTAAALKAWKDWVRRYNAGQIYTEGVERARVFQRNMSQNNRDWGGYVSALIDAWGEKDLDEVPLRGQGYNVTLTGTAKALKADTRHRLSMAEASDAAPAIAKSECNTKQFGSVRLEMPRKGK
jgi:hypothetical protein